MTLSCAHCSQQLLRMVIHFKKNSHNFPPLEVDGNELPAITNCAKMLGVTISSDLKWNKHIFIVLLKRGRVLLNDIVNFYCTTIRPGLEYCAPVFHLALPAYLNEN